MKLVNYALQNQIEYLSEDKTNNHFKEYLQNILEDTSKPYYQRADYIGLSLNEIKSKIDYLSKDISELQALKKKLTNALEIAKEQVATIFEANGIDRIDGNIISSLTISKSTTKEKNIVNILDENKIMGLGFVKFSVDVEAVEKAITTKQGQKELKGLVEVTPMSITTPAKVKVNMKRASVNNSETDEILIIEEQVA
ncbi:siphovirus Gp157 family protein [Halarcobacter bivalviorum]|uniref:Uncharacterized protein n=1 Tax=Halarcobacter bivalviorum TaxID=663364 RepID=A0AAX2A6R0_9BACT|nr:siphovirus Gp157 family protein [Halarcobacter bivalviorum]AXH13047.1 hypothetical protein ABIV_2072 [Halarcobacter bivalviorum]RXK09149.1 hypothetical protein CRV05_11215 [Halarcobacter bivalviorum]